MRDTLWKHNIIQNITSRVSDDDLLPKLTKDVRLSYYYQFLEAWVSIKIE